MTTAAIVALVELGDGNFASASDIIISIWPSTLQRYSCLNNSEYYNGLSPIKILYGHFDQITSLAALKNDTLASGSRDRTINLWNIATCCLLRTLTGHTDWITALDVLPNGRLVSGSYDCCIKIWNIEEIGSIELAAGRNWREPLEDMSSKTLRTSLQSEECWDPLQKMKKKISGHMHPSWLLVTALATFPDGRMAGGYMDGVIRIWDVEAEKYEKYDDHDEQISALIVLPDGKLASGSKDRTIKLWEKDGENFLSEWSCVRTLYGHTGSLTTLAMLPDGKLASGANDKTIRIWDTTTGECKKLTGHAKTIRALITSVIRYTEIETLEMGHIPYGNRGQIISDTMLISGSEDSTIRLWSSSSLVIFRFVELEGNVEEQCPICINILKNETAELCVRVVKLG